MRMSPCGRCRRHVRIGSACPFCGAVASLIASAAVTLLSGVARADEADASSDVADSSAVSDASDAAAIYAPPDDNRTVQPLYGLPPSRGCSGCATGTPDPSPPVAAAALLALVLVRRRTRDDD